MALTEKQRAVVNRKWTDQVCKDRRRLYGLKGQKRSVVDAIDDWIEANQPSFNQALPQPFRSNATAKEKAEALVFVVNQRWEVT